MDYLNLGDALSPVMVSIISGRPVRRVPSKSTSPRLAAVGTIAHGLEGGKVWFWGTGCSPAKNPHAAADMRTAYRPPADTRLIVRATRGPVSARLLAGDNEEPCSIFGDPVWLLPRFYRPERRKKWPLGVILHLSELADRAFEAHPRPDIARYVVPADLKDSVHLINTVTPIGIDALRDRIDEILDCERIVSTSLHGMVIAESYGIPCLYLGSAGERQGFAELALEESNGIDLRVVDLYRGLGKERTGVYRQPRHQRTDWTGVIEAIDRTWAPVVLDEDRLTEAFPLRPRPLVPPAGGQIWDHPLLRGLQFQHDVAELRHADAAAAKAAAASANMEPRTALFWANRKLDVADLSWVATTEQQPTANLGDALSPVIVATLSGLPIRHAHFDEPCERIAAVGTIGHAQRNGIVHYWGTGFDALGVDKTTPFSCPPETELRVHAVRGKGSAAILRNGGIAVPERYGDPVVLLPRIWPFDRVTKRYELGVVMHVSELESPDPLAGPRPDYRRYQVSGSAAGAVHLINTFCAPYIEALRAKVREIVECKRIVSTSLHGLVIAEAYGIPCAWISPYESGGMIMELAQREKIDHRMRDFYSGLGVSSLVAYGMPRGSPVDWQAVIDWLDHRWQRARIDVEPLLASFPLPLKVPPDAAVWSEPDVLRSIRL
jgi:polysaccharide pyruvyl transferase WcaK-like protein